MSTHKRLVGFLPITNPKQYNYPYLESIASHSTFLDHLCIIDGGSTDGSLDEIKATFRDGSISIHHFEWKQGYKQWTWEQFSHTWNFGLSKAKEHYPDYVVAVECDHVFHEKEATELRNRLEENGKPDYRALYVDKWVSSTWDTWLNKSKFAMLINTKDFDDVGYGLEPSHIGGQDLANPIIVENWESEYGVPSGHKIIHTINRSIGSHFYNYDKTFQTKKIITELRLNANWAWNNSCLVKNDFMKPWAEDTALDDVIDRMRERKKKSKIIHNLEHQPKIMHNRLKDIKPDQLGYNLFQAL